MKFNIYQKILLLIYGCLFVYFSIIHVPFRTNYHNEIKYDTLLSNNSNLDVSRLVLIIVILSILTVVLLLLFRSINYSYKPKRLLTRKILISSAIGLAILFVAIFSITKYESEKKNTEVIPNVNMETTDSTSVSSDTTSVSPSFDLNKTVTCTEENALADFKSYMKFYYPDWKIYGSPVVKEQSDCTYRIQFTTLDPHIRNEREVIIVEISYNYDYSRYTCTTIRGFLY